MQNKWHVFINKQMIIIKMSPEIIASLTHSIFLFVYIMHTRSVFC